MHAFVIPHDVPPGSAPSARGAGVASVIYHCGGTLGCGNQFESMPEPPARRS